MEFKCVLWGVVASGDFWKVISCVCGCSKLVCRWRTWFPGYLPSCKRRPWLGHKDWRWVVLSGRSAWYEFWTPPVTILFDVELAFKMWRERRSFAALREASMSTSPSRATRFSGNWGSPLEGNFFSMDSSFEQRSLAMILRSAGPSNIFSSTRSSTTGVMVSVPRDELRRYWCQCVTASRTSCPSWNWSFSGTCWFGPRFWVWRAWSSFLVASCRTASYCVTPVRPRIIQVAANENTQPKDQMSIACETGFSLLPGYSGAPTSN